MLRVSICGAVLTNSRHEPGGNDLLTLAGRARAILYSAAARAFGLP